MSTRFGKGDLLMLLVSFVWGINFPIGKLVLTWLPPLGFASVRFLIASGVLFLLLAINGHGIKARRSDLAKLVLLGLSGIAIFQAAWANGLSLTTASKASILVNVTPIWAALITWAMGEPPKPRAIAGILVSFAGIFVVINNSLTAITIGGGSFTGDLLFVVSAAAWALYGIIGRPLVARIGAVEVSAWAMLIGSLCLLPFGLWSMRGLDFAAVPFTVWLAFAFMTVFSGAFAFVWWIGAVQLIGITRSLAYNNLIPIFAIGMAVMAFGEHFTLVQALGAVVVLTGIRLTRSA